MGCGARARGRGGALGDVESRGGAASQGVEVRAGSAGTGGAGEHRNGEPGRIFLLVRCLRATIEP